MNGVHDMGGMHGFGSIAYERDEPVFHEPWEGRIFAMGLAARSLRWTRFDLEILEPGVYLSSTYYERWLKAFENVLLRDGVITAEELEARAGQFRANPSDRPARSNDHADARRSLDSLRKPRETRAESDAEPRFRAGDAVRVRNINRSGHSRLPRYAQGKRGGIARFYGFQPLQDHVTPGEPAGPQPLYAVRFEARELWGAAAEDNSCVLLDMWESYLEPDS